jgi:hypothetical protein
MDKIYTLCQSREVYIPGSHEVVQTGNHLSWDQESPLTTYSAWSCWSTIRSEGQQPGSIRKKCEQWTLFCTVWATLTSRKKFVFMTPFPKFYVFTTDPQNLYSHCPWQPDSHPPNWKLQFLPFFRSWEIYSTLQILWYLNHARHQWLMPVILATQEAEISRILVWSQPWQIVQKILSKKKPFPKRGLVEWLKL